MTPILVTYLEDSIKPDRWRLERSITYETIVGQVTVPRGYITDFASVPVLLWGIFPPIGRSNRATILHDWWYDNRLFEETLGAKEARRLADLNLLMMLNLIEPKKKIRNYIMYLACRWCGKSWWVN